MDDKITNLKTKIENFNTLMSDTEGFESASKAFAADGNAQINRFLEVQAKNRLLMQKFEAEVLESVESMKIKVQSKEVDNKSFFGQTSFLGTMK